MAHGKILEVAEMRILKWSCRETILDMIGIKVKRNKIKVTQVPMSYVTNYEGVKKEANNSMGMLMKKMRVKRE